MYKSDLNKIPEKSMTNKCIVLDLDETIVHSHTEENSYDLETLKCEFVRANGNEFEYKLSGKKDNDQKDEQNKYKFSNLFRSKATHERVHWLISSMAWF